MAFNANKTPLLKSILARSFSAQVGQKFNASKANELQVTTLSNQILVASIDQSAPTANVSVVYRAGSRDEAYEVQGLTRVLRIGASTLSNKNSSEFRIRTNINAIGGSLSATAEREFFTYNLTVNREQLDTGLKFLGDVSSAQEFKYWEFKPISNRVKQDLAAVSNAERAIDALHQAAFSHGLGNAAYAADTNLSNIYASALQSFVAKNFTSNRTAIVGVGIDHEALLGFAKSFQLAAGSGTATPSKYNAGQLRIDQSGSLATVDIGTQGASSANKKEALAFAVLRTIAGNGRLIQGGSPLSALAKVVDGSLKNPHEFNAFNLSYSDNGLFGFTLTANAQEIGKAVEAAAKALKSGSVSQGDVETAKAALKVATIKRAETAAGRYQDLVLQAASGKVQGKSELIAAIDGVSVADVNAAAKKVASSKWWIGGIGNLATVPHVEELN